MLGFGPIGSAPIGAYTLTSGPYVPPVADTTRPTLHGQIAVGVVTRTTIAATFPTGQDNAGAVTYERSKDGGVTWTNAGSMPGTTWTGLAPETTYPLRIRAVDEAGNRSDPPLEASVTTAAAAGNGNLMFTPSTARTINVLPGKLAFSAAQPGFWNLDSPKKPKGLKDPQSLIDIPFNWGEWLADIADAIAAAEFFFTGGLVDEGQDVTGGHATVFVSGGTPGEAAITCRIVTASSPARIEERTVILIIEDR